MKTDDYHLTPMDKYAKTNIDINETTILERIHNFSIDYIRKNMKTYQSKPIESKKQNSFNDDNDDEFIQISIFDELGD